MAKPDVLFGIFVGGASSRMGGGAKGLLLSRETGEPLVSRLLRIAGELGFEPALVGKADAYARVHPNVRLIADAPAQIGPLGGLGGLLEAAGRGQALAVACDMPRVSSALLKRLATEAPNAAVLAPRALAGMWEPLCARYDASQVRPMLTASLARGVRSFQQLFDALDVQELTLTQRERGELLDWDTPSDIDR